MEPNEQQASSNPVVIREVLDAIQSIADAQAALAYARQSLVCAADMLENHGAQLDGYDAKFADENGGPVACAKFLQSLVADMDALREPIHNIAVNTYDAHDSYKSSLTPLQRLRYSLGQQFPKSE